MDDDHAGGDALFQNAGGQADAEFGDGCGDGCDQTFDDFVEAETESVTGSTGGSSVIEPEETGPPRVVLTAAEQTDASPVPLISADHSGGRENRGKVVPVADSRDPAAEAEPSRPSENRRAPQVRKPSGRRDRWPAGDARDFVRRQFERLPRPFGLFQSDPEPEKSGGESSSPASDSRSAVPDLSLDAAVELLIDALEKKVASWPHDAEGIPLEPEEYRKRQLDLRIARLIADQPAAAAEAIEAMPPQEQKFWQELVLGLAQFRTPPGSMAWDEQMAATISQLRSAVRQLEPVATLTLRRLEFCREIRGFGAVEPMLSDVLQPGDPVLIYAEIGNLAAELSDDGTYRTVFSGSIQLWTVDGTEPLETWPVEAVEEEATSRREDYFLSYRMNLPAHLPSERYELRLVVQDDLTGRRTSGRLRFLVP